MTALRQTFHRRSLLAGVTAGALAVLLAACGDDTVAPVASDSGDTLPPVAEPGRVEHPTGSDEIVLEYGEYGGFVPMSFAFIEQPTVLVSGDGRVFTPGAVPAIFPGPLLPAVGVRTISENGIQRLLVAARDAGLFADVVYPQPVDPIADASTATLRIAAAGERFVHEAYALGFGAESDAQRASLAAFLERLRDLPAMVGADNLGEEQIFEPDAYAIRAIAQPDGLPAATEEGIEPRLVAWPQDAAVSLAAANDCAVVDAAAVGDLFSAADQLTYFEDGGIVYQVFARPVWPGGAC